MGNAAIKPSGVQRVDTILVTPTIFISQQATLSGTPAIPGHTLVSAGGVAQKYTTDYIVSGNVINWASKGLGMVLSIGDILIVEYFTL